ncbi:hypothetical protein Tco_1440158, partial [Tanacetum coccineum]
MHNNIMAVGLRDHPPMLAMGRYAQWQSLIILAVLAIDDSSEVPERTTVETILNMSPETKALYESEKEAIHLLLTKIELSRFVTIVKQQHDLDTVSYHKLFDVLKQYQKEVNEICAERITKNANPLALVAAAQQYLDPYYQAPKSQKLYATPSKQSSSTRSNASTKYKGKEIAKTITSPSVSASEEDRNQKRVKDSTYHKEKMLLCTQAKKGVPLRAEQADWLEDTDEEIDEQDLEAHYSYMAKIQEVPTADSGTGTEPLEQVHNDAEYNVRQHSEQSESASNTCLVEKDDSNVTPDSPDTCDNDIQDDQNVVDCDDERVALANLIANLKLDIDDNKKIQKQLKKANASLDQELKECKSILEETSRSLGKSNSIRDTCLVALQNKQTEFERYKAFNDRTVDYDKLE